MKRYCYWLVCGLLLFALIGFITYGGTNNANRRRAVQQGPLTSDGLKKQSETAYSYGQWGPGAMYPGKFQENQYLRNHGWWRAADNKWYDSRGRREPYSEDRMRAYARREMGLDK